MQVSIRSIYVESIETDGIIIPLFDLLIVYKWQKKQKFRLFSQNNLKDCTCDMPEN